ncbi:MAG: aldehyde dehydrogenase family protein, partial [Humibacter sp.]
EIFGPVLSVLTFRTPVEAIAKANNTPYGLSAGIWTDKGSRMLAVADKLRAGVIWANTFNRFDPASPFGGYKESGYGREGGRHGLAAYLASSSAKPILRSADARKAVISAEAAKPGETAAKPASKTTRAKKGAAK